MNDYEKLLLADRKALETKIANLLEEKLNNNYKVEAELDLIAEVINYCCEIEDTCSFEYDSPYMDGKMTFDSVEEYESKGDFYYADEAANKGVEWSNCADGWGTFSWDDCPSVSVEVLGLTEDASEEARNLWEAQREAEERQEQLDEKRQRLEQVQRELLELQAGIAAAEATA